MLQPVAADVWEASAPQRFLGFAIGTRMVVVRLPGGGLVLHSPVSIDDDLARDIDALGKVEHIVCPNPFHHLYAGTAQARYPEATLSAPDALRKKRRDLRINRTLDERPADGWDGALEPCTIRGCMLGETVLFHRPSRTLLSVDLVEYFEHHDELLTRLYLKAGGVYGTIGWNRLLRFVYRDREAARRSLNRVLAWDIDRISIAHGQIIEGNGRDKLARAFSWL